ncbi:hypothetical protein INT44_005926 [Umbelopsis vinacea]|uniref:GPI mannosyltransferase 2 n=1 Tax=Umbelopsis vinacea TaxID=44442 RepID=A0A8H7UH71_9FUNG|nr:hypothetical protein INT44_005926 [Umbelopsis vinacea]
MSRLLTVYATAASTRVLTILLAVISKAFVDDYDSSAETILLGSSTALIPNKLLYQFFSVFVRWDAFYYLHIAENGYVYEQEHAFFPMLPLLSRLVSDTVLSPFKYVIGDQYTLVLSGVLVSNISFVLAAGVLYKLSNNVFHGNETLAYLSALAFALSPASMFITSFYSESLFALLTFTGMLCVSRQQYIRASVVWGIASATRSNAVMYAGYIVYDLVVRNYIRHRSVKNAIAGLTLAMGCTMLVCLGFITFQVYGYHLYCILDDRPWCQQTIPLMYPFVQKFYWGNGFLAYYELKQIPNFLLASPIIMISCYGIWSYISFDKSRFWTIGMKSDIEQLDVAPASEEKDEGVEEVPISSGFLSDKTLPHIYLWAILVIIVVTSMHVQIVTRFFSCLPVLYWFIGHVWMTTLTPTASKSQKLIAKSILYYQILYGLVGIVLFASFFPPA